MICASYDANLEVRALTCAASCDWPEGQATELESLHSSARGERFGTVWQLRCQMRQARVSSLQINGSCPRRPVSAQELWSEKDAAEQEIEKEAAAVARAHLVAPRSCPSIITLMIDSLTLCHRLNLCLFLTSCRHSFGVEHGCYRNVPLVL
jgi:hypothetical protein